MSSLADEYLFFLSSTISSCSSKLLENNDIIPVEKLTDIIYDYLNEVFLLNKNVGNINFNKVLNIKLNEKENSLFNLFIQYGLTDRIKLKNKNIKKSYIFLVDTINYFINVEKYICRNADFFYSQVFNTILKNQKFLDKIELKKILIENNECIEKIIDNSLDTIEEIRKRFDTFGYKIDKISKENFIIKPSYNNELIYDYNNREVDYVLNEYRRDMYIASMEYLSIDIINELFDNRKNKYFIHVPDYILNSKIALNKLLKLFSLYAVNKCVCLVLSVRSYQKVKDFDLIFNGYTCGMYLEDDADDTVQYDSVEYLIVDYSEDNEKIINKYLKKCTIIVNGKITHQTKDKLINQGIEYFTNSMVIS